MHGKTRFYEYRYRGSFKFYGTLHAASFAVWDCTSLTTGCMHAHNNQLWILINSGEHFLIQCLHKNVPPVLIQIHIQYGRTSTRHCVGYVLSARELRYRPTCVIFCFTFNTLVYCNHGNQLRIEYQINKKWEKWVSRQKQFDFGNIETVFGSEIQIMLKCSPRH